MNFKLFRATHKKSHDTTSSELIIDRKTFLKELKKAINNNTLDAFIVNIFDTYPLPTTQAPFVTFFDNCRTAEFEGTFFTVCDSICRNISHLDEEVAISLVNTLTKKYYENQIYNTKEAVGHSLLSYLMTHLPASLLEEAVLVNFDGIVKELFYSDIKYLGTYDSWRKELHKYFRDIMELFVNKSFNRYMDFAKMYPELAPAVYEYVLEIMLEKSETCFDIPFDDDFDLINDFLRPMSDLEKYQGYYFASVRRYAKEILDYTDGYTIFYDTGDFLIENFGVSPELVNQVIDDTTDELIHYINDTRSSSDILEMIKDNTFNDFFRSSRAYDRFMSNLPCLLMNSGILLYAVLLIVLGPIYELTNNEGLCREYFTEAEALEKSEVSVCSSDDLNI